MKYENYKRFFKGGFYPVDSVHSLVNIEDTGEFSVRTIVGPNQVRTDHYVPSLIGLTNVLNSYTGGSRFESLAHSGSTYFIPEIADCTSYTGVQKAIISYFERRNEPIILDLEVFDSDTWTVKLTFSSNSNKVIDWGDGNIDKGTGDVYEHNYGYAGIHRVTIYGALDGAISVERNGSATLRSPIFTTVVSGSTADYAVKYLHTDAGSFTINTDSSYDVTGRSVLAFGDTKNGPVNVNTGLADWTNLEELAPSLTSVTLNCKNLHFDWKELEFANQVKLEVYPDDLTCHTAIEYFATKATYSDGSKPILQILNGPNVQNVYNWAQQYADKFDSIEIV